MMVKASSNEPPPYTDLVRETHTHKDGTFIDARAETVVLEIEEAVTQLTAEDGSPNGTSQTASTGATRNLLNTEYIKRGQSSRGCIYGICSVQFRDLEPKESVPASLKCSLDMDIHLSSLEAHSESVNNNVETLKTDMMTLKEEMGALKSEFKADMSTVKEEMLATRVALNMILQTLQQTSHCVGATNPTVSTNVTPPVHDAAINPTPTGPSTTSALPMTQAHQSDLDRWCASLL